MAQCVTCPVELTCLIFEYKLHMLHNILAGHFQLKMTDMQRKYVSQCIVHHLVTWFLKQ